MKNKFLKTQKITLISLFSAIAVAFSIFESSLPALFFLPLGCKIGLSNIVSMYTLSAFSFPFSFFVTLIKSTFIFFFKGPVAFLMSFSGGIISIFFMFILLNLKKLNLSIIFISIVGALSHNLAQFFIASFLLSTNLIFYLPILLLFGTLSGFITGITLKVTSPAIKKVYTFYKT